MEKPSTPAPSWPRRLWRWVYRGLLACLILLVLLVAVVVVFHRPLVLWALNSLGPAQAKKAGVELQWQAEGSVWSDLTLNNVQAKLPGYSVQIKHLALSYDLLPALHSQWLKIPKGVVINDVSATIDLRHPAPAPPKPAAKPADPKELVAMLRQFVPPNIDLQHISATVLMPDATLAVHDFSLVVPPGQEGTLSVASVEHPALAQYPLHDVTAKLRLTGTSLDITSLTLPPRVEVPELKLDAADYDKGIFTLDTQVRSGGAGVAVQAKADVHGDHPVIDATVDVTGVNEKEVAPWLPTAPEWRATVNKLHVTAKGDPMNPRTLAATVTVDVTKLGYQQWQGDSVHVEARLANGRLDLAPLTIEAGGNRIEATTHAEAPADWPSFAKASLPVKWKVTAPTLQSIVGLPVKVSGAVNAEGQVKIENQEVRGFDATLAMRDIAVDQNQMKALDAKVTGDLKKVVFEAKAMAAAGDGQLDAHGNLGLEAGTLSDATWEVVLPQPEALVRSLNLAWPDDLAVGELSTDGSASFDLAKLKASQFNEAKGTGKLQVQQLAWRNAPCPQVALAWKLEQGKAVLSGLDVDLPAASHVHVEGSLELAGKQSFDGSLNVSLPQLAALEPFVVAAMQPPAPPSLSAPVNDPPLLPAADALTGKDLLLMAAPTPFPPLLTTTPPPVLQGGSVTLEWKGNGALKDQLDVHGTASLTVSQARVSTLPEAVSLNTQFTHDLNGATIQEFTALLGPWAASLRGSLAKTGVDLTSIEASHSGKRLVSGSVQVPLDLLNKPIPLDQVRPINVHINTEGQLKLAELAGLGKASLPEGLSGLLGATIEATGNMQAPLLHIEVKGEDLHLPKAPGKEPGHVSLLVDLKDGVLTADTVASLKPLEPLSAHVKAKVDTGALMKDSSKALDTPFEASVKLNQPTLAFVTPLVPMLDDLRGSLQIDASASGTVKSPHAKGLIAIDMPLIQPHDTDLPLIKNLKARITADDLAVKIESFHALVAGGEVSASGTCNLKDMTKPGFDVSLKARDMLVIRNETMSVRTDADLNCKGIPTAASLTGSIGLTRGRVFKEINFLPLSKIVNDLPPLPDAEARAAQTANAASANTSPLPPMLAGWTFDVALKTKDSIRLLGNALNGGVKVDLALSGKGSAPQVIGTATLEDALVNLPFSTLRVTKGIVAFTKDQPLAPTLDLVAESTVDVYDIVLRGYGSALDPKVHFSSTPPLSEGDIASLLATGSTASGLQKAGDDAAGRALLYVVREAYRRAFLSNAKPVRKGEKASEHRFIVQERSADGQLGGVTGTYEFSRKFKIIGSTTKQGGFSAIMQYLFRFN